MDDPEASQLICNANQVIGFQRKRFLALNGLKKLFDTFLLKSSFSQCTLVSKLWEKWQISDGCRKIFKVCLTIWNLSVFAKFINQRNPGSLIIFILRPETCTIFKALSREYVYNIVNKNINGEIICAKRKRIIVKLTKAR